MFASKKNLSTFVRHYIYSTMKYSFKSTRTKWILLIFGFGIVFIFFFQINRIVNQLRNEEQLKIKLWANAITRKAQLVERTEVFFKKVTEEERIRLQQFVTAQQYILSQPLDADLTLSYDIIANNKTIPVIITDEFNYIIHSQNVDIPKGQKVLVGSLLDRFSERKPIEYYVSDIKFKLYYAESNVYKNMKETLIYFTNNFLNDVVNNYISVPVIITDSTKTKIIAFGNVKKNKMSPENLAETISQMEKDNPPISINLPNAPNAKIFREKSRFILALQYYPVVYTVITIFFVILILQLFKAMKRSEQNSIWIGLNKETAHQLGTPISSLVAWVEYLKLDPKNEDICKEITKDINRLDMITQRFSQVGKSPKLESQNIIPVIKNSVNYLSARCSKKIIFTLDMQEDFPVMVQINQHLFEWTLENIVKNAIDAMNGIGTLTISLVEDNKRIYIDISDTGKGLAKKQFKKIFEPGYTTKERGWGMGLSLAKRIIVQYHKGKIFVKQSIPGKGTTFRIILKKTM